MEKAESAPQHWFLDPDMSYNGFPDPDNNLKQIRIRDEQSRSYSERFETIFGLNIILLRGSGIRDGKNSDPG
jgi:hypothetical protein